MAIVVNATKISLDSTKTPSGFTDPGGVNLSSSQPTYANLALNITKSTVENATKSTTFDNIRTDAVVGIEKQVLDLITANIENTIQTVTYNIDWKNITNNQTFPADFYNDAVAVYIATVDVYVNIT
jgi:hypothetical protein